MTALRDKIAAILGTSAEPKVPVDFAAYHQRFRASGIEKATTIIQECHRRNISLDNVAYLSIGGSTGAEVAHILRNTPIRHGYLLEHDPDATRIAEEESRRLGLEHKVLKICCGDAMTQIARCKDQLLEWRRKGLVRGLVCSMQAVLHELGTRSDDFDLNYLLGEIVWDWAPCTFTCREPCAPSGWPDQVRLLVPGIGSDLLEQLALDIARKLHIRSKVRRAGPEFITLSSSLAVELLFKVFYIDDYAYEVQERVTSFAADDLVRAIERTRLGPNAVSQLRLNSLSFEALYRQMNVQATDEAGNGLPLPVTFLWIIAHRCTYANPSPKNDAPPQQLPVSLAPHTGCEPSRMPESRSLERQRKAILNTPIVPWTPMKSPSLGFLWPDLLADPRLSFHKHPTKPRRLVAYCRRFQWRTNIALIGDAGSGKSTTLRYAFLWLAEHREDERLPYPVIAHASEYIDHFRGSSRESLLSRSIDEAEASTSKIVYLIDGIDELDTTLVAELFAHLEVLDARRKTFWLSCRKDYFARDIGMSEKRTALLTEVVELCEWDIQHDSRPFVEGFCRRAKVAGVLKAFDCLALDAQAAVFLRNPFRLTLVLYLLSVNADTKYTFKNMFALYRDFYQHWIARESHRKTSKLNARVIAQLHTSIAFDHFSRRRRTYGENRRRLPRLYSDAMDDTAFGGLLHITSESTLVGFHHETIGEYLIAARVLRALEGTPREIQSVLSKTYTFDINVFVRHGIALLTPDESQRLSSRLCREYYRYAAALYPKSDALPKMLPATGGTKHRLADPLSPPSLRIREQLLYYIGRVPAHSYPTALTFAFHHEDHRLLARIAALGAMLHGNFEIECKYMSYLVPKSVWDIDNRSVQLVYFADVDADLYEFVDDDRCSWAKTRAAIFSRIGSRDDRDIRLRWWDMRTLLLFLQSRPFATLTQDEVSIVRRGLPLPGETGADRLKCILKEQRSLMTHCRKAI